MLIYINLFLLKKYYAGKPSLNKNHLDYVPNVFSLNAPKRKADMYEELMDRLKEKRHAMLREENAVKGMLS